MTNTLREIMYKAVATLAAITALNVQAQDICTSADAVEGRVAAILEAGNRVYVTTYDSGDHPDGGGIYISCNGGDDWHRHADFDDGGGALAVDPTDSATVYFGGVLGDAWVSRDAGETWVLSRPEEFSNVNVTALAALAGGTVLAGQENGGLKRSADYGATWETIDAAWPSEKIHSILLDPADSNRILISVGDGGIYYSVDGGTSFDQSGWASTLLPPSFWQSRDLEFLPGDASQVFAVGLDGLWQSVDAGNEFSRVPGADEIVDISFGRRDTGALFLVEEFAGLQRSDDNGVTLNTYTPNLPRATDWYTRGAQLASGRLLLGTTFEGLWMSDDEGATWQVSGATPSDPPPVVTPPPVSVTANLNLSIEDLNGPDAIEIGTRAKFRITVRNDGPDASTNTFVNFIWVLPNTNDAPSGAYTLSSSAGSCTTGPNSDDGCDLGTLINGQSVTIDFEGTTSTSFIGTHQLTVTARNAENSEVVANGSVATKRTVACIGDCDDGGSGGGSFSIWLLLLLLGSIVRRVVRSNQRDRFAVRTARLVEFNRPAGSNWH